MIEIPDDVGERDYGQWLTRGVVLVPHEGRYVPAVVTGVEESHVFCRHIVGLPGELSTGGYDVSEVRLSWPDCGSVNVHVGPRGRRAPYSVAVYVKRRQQRQYTRALNSRCIRCRVPGLWWARRAGVRTEQVMGPVEQCFPLAKALFDPDYPLSWAEVQARLAREDTPSVALSPHLIIVGVALAGSSNEARVYCRGDYAALVDTLSGEMRQDPNVPEENYLRAMRALKRYNRTAGGLKPC